MLARKYRLKKNREFQRVYRHGSSIANQYLVLYFVENGLNYNRVGFSISKKLGKAVRRNYLKRLLSELYYHQMKKVIPGYDLVFIVRNKAKEGDLTLFQEAFNDLLERSNLLKEKGGS